LFHFIERVEFHVVASVDTCLILCKVLLTLRMVNKVKFDFVTSVYWV